MPHRNNLVNRLAPDILVRLTPHLTILIAEMHQRVGVGTSATATAMIGQDGEFGANQALDDKVSLNHVVIRVAVTASVIDAERLCHFATKSLPSAASW